MRGFAMDLIQASATQASAKLQFARFAYGAGGSATDSIDIVEAETVTRGYLAATKAELVWKAPTIAAPTDAVKLMLNFVMIGLDAIPYGGSIEAIMEQETDALQILVSAKGKKAHFSDLTRALLTDEGVTEALDPRSIQAYYAALITRSLGIKVTLSEGEEQIALCTRFPMKSDS